MADDLAKAARAAGLAAGWAAARTAKLAEAALKDREVKEREARPMPGGILPESEYNYYRARTDKTDAALKAALAVEERESSMAETAAALEEVASVVVALAAAATDETRAALTDEALAVEREIRDEVMAVMKDNASTGVNGDGVRRVTGKSKKHRKSKKPRKSKKK